MAGGLPTLTGTALAQLSWDVLWENALAGRRRGPRPPGHARRREGDRGEHAAVRARASSRAGSPRRTPIHNGLTAVAATHGLAHGQKVNIGSVTQLVLEGAPTREIRDFIEFTTRVGLPTTLTEVGLQRRRPRVA